MLELPPPARDPRSDPRPQQALEPGALLAAGKGRARQRAAVDAAVGSYGLAEVLHDRLADLWALIQLVYDLIA